MGEIHDLEPGLGVGGTQGQAALLIFRRHGVEGRDRHGHDAGQDHDRQHHDGRQQAGTGRLAKGLCHGGHQHLHAQQAEHHAGDAGKQLDGRDHHRAHLRAGRLGQEHRREQADGHTDEGGTQRTVHTGQDKGQDAELRVGGGGGPLGAKQEPEQADLVDGRNTGEDHVHRDEHHAAHRQHAAQEEDEIHHRFQPVGRGAEQPYPCQIGFFVHS